MRRILLLVLMVGALGSTSQATVLLTLNPVNGALAGDPGTTVGWGFTIYDNNPAGEWVEVIATDFCSSFTAPNFPCDGTNPPGNGTYQDFTPFNFVLSGPNSPDTSQQNFSYNPPCGVGPCTGTGGFTINMNSPIGTLITGKIVVDYFLFFGDPNNGGLQDGGDHFITANASVLVAPEPATWLLLGSSLAGLGLARFRRRKKS